MARGIQRERHDTRARQWLLPRQGGQPFAPTGDLQPPSAQLQLPPQLLGLMQGSCQFQSRIQATPQARRQMHTKA